MMFALILLHASPRADAESSSALTCRQRVVDVFCHPTRGLVLPDNNPAGDMSCAPNWCHASSLDVPHGYVNDTAQHVAVGESVVVSCNAGFEHARKAGTTSRPRCLDSCTFERPAPCVRVKCPAPSEDPNGRMQHSGSSDTHDRMLVFGEYVRVTCNHGFMASPSEHVYGEPCQSSYISECQSDGTMSNGHVHCEPQMCPRIPDPLLPRGNSSHHSSNESWLPLVSPNHVKAGQWMPSGPLSYQETATLSCDSCMKFNGTSNERRCTWTCQYKDAADQGQCVYKPCNFDERPAGTATASDPSPTTGTQWFGGAPQKCGDVGILRCNRSGFVMQGGGCSVEERFSCVPSALHDNATLDKPMRACVQATCSRADFDSPNTDITDTSAKTFYGYGETVSAQCRPGFRARFSHAQEPVLCSHSNKPHAIRCGVSELGDPGYAPCAWNISLSCVPVTCPVAEIAHGLIAAASASHESLDGMTGAGNGTRFLRYGFNISITCNVGYRITTDADVRSLPWSAATTANYTCDEVCTPFSLRCVPVRCPIFASPKNSSAVPVFALSNHSSALQGSFCLHSGCSHSMRTVHLELGDTVELSCADNWRFANMSCQHSMAVTCSHTGEVTFLDNLNSSLSPANQTCVPITCSNLNTQGSVGNLNMSVAHAGDSRLVTCSAGHRAPPPSFTGKYALCNHSTSFSAVCDPKTCSFPDQPSCMPIGCSKPTTTTSDGLYPLAFKDNGVQLNLSTDGGLHECQNVTVICPVGYRFSSFCPPFNCTRSSTTPFLTPSSTTQEPTPSSCSSAETFDTLTAVGSNFKDSRHQSGVAFCLSNGNVSQFECSPVRCPLFAIPNNSHTSGSDFSGFKAGGVGAHLQWADNLTIVCDPHHKLAGMPCDQRSFSVMCNEDGQIEYVGNFSSPVLPSSLACVPAECNVDLVNSSNGVRHPAGGEVKHGAVVTVDCMEFHRVKPIGYPGAYPNASHPSSFSVRCDSNLCAFPSSLRCDLQGCVVQPAHISGNGGHSTGGADHIRYEKNGQHIDPNEDVELLLGENITITCPRGYHVRTTASTPPNHPNATVMPDDPVSANATCRSDGTIDRIQCSPVECKRFAMPVNARAVIYRNAQPPGHAMNGVLNDLGRTVHSWNEIEVIPVTRFGDDVKIECSTDHILAHEMSCDQRSFVMRCGEDGEFAYVNSTVSAVPPRHQKCVPIECQVSQLDDPNAITSPSRGAVRAGESATVICRKGFHVRAADFSGLHPLCAHGSSGTTLCNASTCRFDPHTPCELGGCVGMPQGLLHKTVDGLQHLIFERVGWLNKSIDVTLDGQLSVNESVNVLCPEGYRVDTKTPGGLSSPRSATAACAYSATSVKRGGNAGGRRDAELVGAQDGQGDAVAETETSYKVKFSLTFGSYTSSQITDEIQATILEAVAAALGVNTDDVIILSIVDARRRLLAGVKVNTEVKTADAAAAAAVAASVNDGAANINAKLKARGLATATVSAALIAVPAQEPPSECSIARVECHPISCRSFTLPLESSGVVYRTPVIDGIPSRSRIFTAGPGEELKGLLFNDTVTISCAHNYRLAGLQCSQRAFTVVCGDAGEFVHVAGGSLSVPPVEMKCVPIECNVSSLASSNSMLDPASGVVRAGQSVTVTCNSGFHVKPANYTGLYSLCHHEQSETAVCNASTCAFASLGCSPRGCYGLSPETHWGASLHNISVETLNGSAIDITSPGLLAVNGQVRIGCPVGHVYSDSAQPSAIVTAGSTSAAQARRLGTASCQADCNLTPFECRLVLCGDFVLPADAKVTSRVSVLGGWRTAEIAQSSFYPDEGNNLTVSLAVNIEVAAGCTLILSGLKGTQTASTPNLTIAEDAGGAVASSGEWQQADGILRVRLTSPLRPSTPRYVFRFTLRNSALMQPGQAVRIALASGCDLGAFPERKMTVPDSILLLPGSVLGEGQTAPLKTVRKGFVLAHVGQVRSEAQSGLALKTLRTLTVTFAVSSPMTAAVMTLTGLASSQFNSTQVALKNMSENSFNPLASVALDSSERALLTLETSPGHALLPHHTYRFSFEVLRPSSAAELREMRIDASNGTISFVGAALDVQSELGQWLSAGITVSRLVYGEELTVSCKKRHHILSSIENCSQSFTVQCSASGAFVSEDVSMDLVHQPALDRPYGHCQVQCRAPPKRVYCEECHKYMGGGWEPLVSLRDVGLAVNCSADNRCQTPPYAQAFYDLDVEDSWRGTLCPKVLNSTELPCMRVRCRPLLARDLPANVAALELMSRVLPLHAYDAPSTSHCGSNLTVICKDGFVPQSRVRLGINCLNNSSAGNGEKTVIYRKRIFDRASSATVAFVDSNESGIVAFEDVAGTCKSLLYMCACVRVLTCMYGHTRTLFHAFMHRCLARERNRSIRERIGQRQQCKLNHRPRCKHVPPRCQ